MSSQQPMAATLSSPQGGSVILNDRKLIMLGSNNYLGLASEPVVIEAAVAAVKQYGLGTCINPCFVRTPVHARLELELAAHLGTEDALLFASCSAANAGILATLAGKGDVIFSDRMNHASIIDACRLSRADAAVYEYRDVESLRRQLSANSCAGARLIITDGVFSMEGHLAPLPDLLSLARSAGATLVVDDSHATGVIGDRGAGSLSAAGASTEGVVITGTFSKALGGAPGGFVAASRAVTDQLRRQSRSFIFTTGMSVADAAGALAALQLLREDRSRLQRLWINTRVFRSLLRTRGFKVEDAPSPITPLQVGNSQRAKTIQARLLELGVYLPAMTFPIVAAHDARLRAQPSAALSGDEVERAVDAIAQAFKETAT